MGVIHAVAYIRRSTKDQAQSLERQRHEIERYVAEHGVQIVRWYEDDGISGTEDTDRPGFQRMITDAEQQRDVTAILVHELSRFGRFDAYQLGSWLNRLRLAGVRVLALAGTVRDPYSREGKLLLALEQDRQESVRLSLRTLSGQRETATKGLRAGGKVPYGYARRRTKPDGTIEALGRLGRAKRDKSESIELVPGDPKEIETVRLIFAWARAGSGYRTIASRLNDRGIPSPDAHRQTTRPTTRGRWTATTIRSLLLNPAYAGDAVWNVRSMPKFHRLEADQIRELDGFEAKRFRINSRDDWITVRNAHPALVDRETFDLVHRRIRTHPSMPRGHVHEYLLTGLMVCGNCGEVMTGTTRVRRKRFSTGDRAYRYPSYVCAGSLRAKGCRQVGVPRDGFERAILRILDEEVFSTEGLDLLEQSLRSELARRDNGHVAEVLKALEQREHDLAERVAAGARRLLQVDEDLVAEVRSALADLKAELQRVRATLDAEKRAASAGVDAEGVVRRILDSIRSMATLVHDSAVPLERRREVLRKLLPAPPGQRPIRIEFDFAAGPGWRRAMRRATVRHVSLRRELVASKMVAGAETCATGQPRTWVPDEAKPQVGAATTRIETTRMIT